jgi:phospholipase C
MAAPDRSGALDHVVVVLFENRSLDNVLGHLYGPGDGKTFDGVIGKDLSNPIPAWAEHGADRQVVPYIVATDMDSPNPDSGEEFYHANTQLYGVLDDHNRFKIGEAVTAPWNAPPPGAAPTMDGFVADYISTFTGEMGRQPTYEEYAQIMTGCTPEQLPVLNGIARDFGVFDHWFCEVPSQTFMNRSFWTAATSWGWVRRSPGGMPWPAPSITSSRAPRPATREAGRPPRHILYGARGAAPSAQVHSPPESTAAAPRD